MTACGLTPGLILTATQCQIQLARLLAQTRQRGHDHCRTKGQSLGSKSTNFAADFWGALAEILLLDALERAGYRPYFALLKDRPPFGLDVQLDGRTFDIKASPPGKPYLCINADSHDKAQSLPDCYIPGLFTGNDTLLVGKPVLYEDVTLWWDRMDNRHSPYYSINRKDLRLLDNLAELLNAR
jgi:hypothetical protein